jgi:AcrR family transcriptional regulator
MGGDRLNDVLDATYACLRRYGVRRTTMDDIATEMGVSRSAVYQYVKNKDDAFRRLAKRLHDEALAKARAAADAPDRTAEERIRGVLEAKLELVLALMGETPHAAELLDAKARLFGDICNDFADDLRGMLSRLFREAFLARGLRSVRPAQAADICLALVCGLENAPDGRSLLRPGADAVLSGLLAPG